MPVYKDTTTGTWYTKFRYKTWDGQTKYKTKRGFKTKREASQWETSFKASQDGGLDMTFGDFVKVYEDEHFPRLKESTKVTKENIINGRILPYFKDKKLNEIEPKDIIKWQNELLDHRDANGNTFSKSYLQTVHSQMSAILNHAVKYYGLSSNPASIAGGISSKNETKINFWTLEEYRKFSDVMMDEPTMYYAFEVLYWLGLREGEMLALTKDDFDFSEKAVSISKTYQIVRGEPMITSPKTAKSNRIVLMPDFLCEEMQDYLDSLPKNHEGRIFPLSKSALHRHMDKGSEKAGVKRIRIHDLRHSHASLLINMGFSAVAIADRLGHESIHVTYEYAHLFPTVQSTISSQLNSLMEDMHHE